MSTEKILIQDERLTPELKRVRSGRKQAFYLPTNRSLQTEDADITLEPPEPHIYAELIDGQWYWLNGCAECNGEPRDWGTYIECEEHNRCRTCGIKRAELTEAPWAGKNGWQCKPCADIEKRANRLRALEAAAAEEFDEYDYMHNTNIKCPHCNHEYKPCTADGLPEGAHECDVCGGEYSIEPEPCVYYTTRLIGERLTLDGDEA